MWAHRGSELALGAGALSGLGLLRHYTSLAGRAPHLVLVWPSMGNEAPNTSLITQPFFPMELLCDSLFFPGVVQTQLESKAKQTEA